MTVGIKEIKEPEKVKSCSICGNCNVKVKINDQWLCAMLDSGAKCSILNATCIESENFVKFPSTSRNQFYLTAMGDDNIKVIGQLKSAIVEFEDQKPIVTSLLVGSLAVDRCVVIGADLLRKAEVIINSEDMQVPSYTCACTGSMVVETGSSVDEDETMVRSRSVLIQEDFIKVLQTRHIARFKAFSRGT